MKLYNYFRSSASFRVRIALAIKGLTFEYFPVHLVKDEQHSENYARISTTGLVPTLITDEGETIGQSLAIMEYLEEIKVDPPLLPATPIERAYVRALAQTIACEIHPLNNLRVLKYLVSELGATEDAKLKWYRQWVRAGLEAFERELERHPGSVYCFGDTPTIADCCLVPQIFNANRFGVDLTGLPLTKSAFDACMQLQAFQESQPSACPDSE